MRVPLGWGRVSTNLPSSQALLPRRPSLARHPCPARLASRSPPAASESWGGVWGPYSPPGSPRHPHRWQPDVGDNTLTTCPGSPGTPGGPCNGDMSRNQAASQAPGTAKGWVWGAANTYPWAGGAKGSWQAHVALGARQALQWKQTRQRGMEQPGPWLPLWEDVLEWDWLILGRLDCFGQPGGYRHGGYEYSHGCWSQAPPDHPGKNTLH